MKPPTHALADPFDLPDWLGTTEVTWHAESAETGGHHVRGELRSADGTQPCDLVAVDQAYPAPVADDEVRRLAHQAWRNGEVLLVTRDERLALAVPGTGFAADRILTALTRLARAVGAPPENFVAALRLGIVRDDG